MPPSTHSPLLPNASNQLVILRIRSLLIQHLKRLPIQLRKLPFEANPVYPRNIIPVIILHKQRQIIRIPEFRPLDRQLLHIVRLANRQALCRREVCCGGEINIVPVMVHLQSLRAGVRRIGADEDGVEF